MPKDASSINRPHNVAHRSPFPTTPRRSMSPRVAWRRIQVSPSLPTGSQLRAPQTGPNLGADDWRYSRVAADFSESTNFTSGSRLSKSERNHVSNRLEGTPRDSEFAVHDPTVAIHGSEPVAARTNRHAHLGRESQIERMQHQQLQEKASRIEKLESRIRSLETSKRRLKAQILETNDRFANKDAELGEVSRAFQIAQEKLDEKEIAMRRLISEVHQYQGWWLDGHYCLKVALKLARNKNDEGVKAMQESSHARFMKWSSSHES